MPANTSPLFTLTPLNKGAQFVNADSTTKKSIYTAGSNGGRIDAIMVSSNSTAAENLAFYINDGTTDFYLGNVNIPIGSGYTTVARVEGLAQIGPPYTTALILAAGYILKANAVAAVTSAKTVDVIVMAGDF